MAQHYHTASLKEPASPCRRITGAIGDTGTRDGRHGLANSFAAGCVHMGAASYRCGFCLLGLHLFPSPAADAIPRWALLIRLSFQRASGVARLDPITPDAHLLLFRFAACARANRCNMARAADWSERAWRGEGANGS